MRGLVVLVCLTSAARADAPNAADSLFDEGRSLLSAGKAQEACDKFSQAIALDPDAAGTMLNLGLCNKQLGKLKTALYWFRKAQTRANETHAPAYETSARDNAVELAPQVATIKITFSATPPPNTHVRIDGELIKPDDYSHVELDPGQHQLAAGAPGMKVFQHEIAGTSGQTVTIDVVAGDSSTVIDRGKTTRRIALGVAGGGLALAATGAYVVIEAASKYNECASDGHLKAPPPASCGTDPRGQANHERDIARYLGTPLVVGGTLAIAAGAVLFFTAPSKERVQQIVWRPAVSPSSVGIAVGGAF